MTRGIESATDKLMSAAPRRKVLFALVLAAVARTMGIVTPARLCLVFVVAAACGIGPWWAMGVEY